ncbi:hypothetical protein HBI65_245950 [Parastagonospora nodorum]|nr:hypothetical protein HBI65_245950 [Parastagonospora nodorum]
MDRFCTICGFQPKTYAGLAKHIARYRKVHICAADSLSSTVTVYNHIEKDKNADLAIADGISDALDMCVKDDLEVLFQTHDRQLAGELATAESITAKDSNHVDTFSLDFAFLFAAWLQQIKCTLGDIDSLFADAMLAMQSGIQDDIWIQEDIAKTSSNTDYSVRVYHELHSGDCTLLAGFIPTTKIRDPLLKSQVYHYCIGKLLLQNVAKSRILLACADRRIRQCYLTICAILANYEEQVLLTGVKKNRYYMRCTKHYNFNIHVSLATDTLHLLLKGLVIKMLDFMQDILDDIYPTYIQGALERINVFKEEFRVYQRTLGEKKNFNYSKALDSICTRANSEAHYITIVKQFYSMTNKKEYILQICLHNSWRTALLAADYATVSIPGIQPYLIKLPLSEVAANIAISDFIHVAAVCISVQIHSSIKCWQSSSKRHNDSKHCNEEVLYLILTIIDYTRYDKDRKHMAYIRAFSEVLLFNNNRQIDNTTGMLSVRRRAWNAASKRWTLQAFKFYDLSTIICPVHLVLRDLPNSTTRTTMSYYVNNYIDWDKYNRLYSLIFNIDLLRML